MVSLIPNISEKSTKSQRKTSEKGNIRRTIQYYMYGPTPSGRPNTKTARDPSRGHILIHKDHNLKSSGHNASCSWKTKIGSGTSTATQTTPKPGDVAATADSKSVLQRCDKSRWRRSRKTKHQLCTAYRTGKLLLQHNSSPLKYTALSNTVLNLKQYEVQSLRKQSYTRTKQGQMPRRRQRNTRHRKNKIVFLKLDISGCMWTI
jgi:hypothetical protein